MRYACFILLPVVAAASPAAAQVKANPADAAAVASACGGEVSQEDFQKLSKAQQTQKLACFTREAAARFNATLPQQVDKSTTLLKVSAQGTQLTYYYRVDLLLAEIRPGAVDAFKPTVAEKVCNAEDMRSIIASGGSYRYEWADRNGAAIGSLVVNSCPGIATPAK